MISCKLQCGRLGGILKVLIVGSGGKGGEIWVVIEVVHVKESIFQPVHFLAESTREFLLHCLLLPPFVP